VAKLYIKPDPAAGQDPPRPRAPAPPARPDPASAILAARLEAAPFLPEASGRTDWFLELVRDAYAVGFTDSRRGGDLHEAEAQAERAAEVRRRAPRASAAKR